MEDTFNNGLTEFVQVKVWSVLHSNTQAMMYLNILPNFFNMSTKLTWTSHHIFVFPIKTNTFITLLQHHPSCSLKQQFNPSVTFATLSSIMLNITYPSIIPHNSFVNESIIVRVFLQIICNRWVSTSSKQSECCRFLCAGNKTIIRIRWLNTSSTTTPTVIHPLLQRKKNSLPFTTWKRIETNKPKMPKILFPVWVVNRMLWGSI